MQGTMHQLPSCPHHWDSLSLPQTLHSSYYSCPNVLRVCSLYAAWLHPYLCLDSCSSQNHWHKLLTEWIQLGCRHLDEEPISMNIWCFRNSHRPLCPSRRSNSSWQLISLSPQLHFHLSHSTNFLSCHLWGVSFLWLGSSVSFKWTRRGKSRWSQS